MKMGMDADRVRARQGNMVTTPVRASPLADGEAAFMHYMIDVQVPYCVSVSECVCVCARARACACVRARACMRMCDGRGESTNFAADEVELRAVGGGSQRGREEGSRQ